MFKEIAQSLNMAPGAFSNNIFVDRLVDTPVGLIGHGKVARFTRQRNSEISSCWTIQPPMSQLKQHSVTTDL